MTPSLHMDGTVMEFLQYRRATAAEIVAHVGHRFTVDRAVSQLLDEGLIHVVEYAKPGPRGGRPARVLALSENA